MIKFYSSQRDFGWLSNFSRHAIEMDGKSWPTVEHYYQAMKATSTVAQDSIRLADTPGSAKRLGKQVAMRPDWEQVKMEIMKNALIAKFTQHPELRDKLMETGYDELVEDSPIDWEWGCGSDGRGENKLGKLLMEVRQELR
jgi:ribA/ribD-fused uncharacterized protein